MYVLVDQPPVHLQVLFAADARHSRRELAEYRSGPKERNTSMEKNLPAQLTLEVEQIESRARPGCNNSSSTSPLCTCPIGPGVTT